MATCDDGGGGGGRAGKKDFNIAEYTLHDILFDSGVASHATMFADNTPH